MRVINTGDKPFDFTAAVHSYFEVVDISKARIRGLKGLTYLDKVQPATDRLGNLYRLENCQLPCISLCSACNVLL